MFINNAKFFKGNIKVGDMLTWSKLAGSGIIQGCKGTCGQFCAGCYNPENPNRSSCYVFKSYRIYKGVAPAHIRNTEAMRKDLKGTFDNLDKQLTRSKKKLPVRIHASGELESAEELFGWIALAKKHPDRPFYIYTKNEDVVDEVMTKLVQNKKALPDNFYINISIWHCSGIPLYNRWKNRKNIRAFVYLDDFDYSEVGLNVTYTCPAYAANGKMDHRFTCDKCKICFSDRHKVCGCYDH